MRILYFIPLLVLFVAPWVIEDSRDLVSRSNQSPSAPERALRDDSEPSRVTTSAPITAPIPSVPAKADAESQTAASAASASAFDATPVESFVPTPAEASATSTPGASPASAQSDFSEQVEAEVLRLTNIERTTSGLAMLAPDTKLQNIAWGHSADMLANGYFSHDNLTGCSSSCRATNARYHWRVIGENIYMMSGYKLTPEKAAAMVVEGWMNSAGHRANILGTSFTESGVGVVYDGTSIYITTLYAKPR